MQNRSSATDRLERVASLRDAGLFAEALKALDNAPSDIANRLPAQVLKGELLERVGRRRESEALISRALRSKLLSGSDRSLAELTLARIRIEFGGFDAAITHLNKSISIAKRSGNIERLGFGQLKLLTLLSDGIGTDATGPLVAEVRATAIRSGSPRLLSAVHVYFAQIEALRGSVRSANRHIRLAKEILQSSPNFWLDSVLENIRLAISIMQADFETAQACSKRGKTLAEQTGGAAEYVVNQGNSGFVFHALGKFEEAIQCYEQTLSLLAPGSQNYSGTLDSIARVRLAQGHLDEAEALLRKVDELTEERGFCETYVYRHAQLTRARLEMRRGNSNIAQQILKNVLDLAKKANDRLLEITILISQIDLAVIDAKLDQALDLTTQAARSIPDAPADVYGFFDRAVSRICEMTGDSTNAAEHRRRAERVLSGLTNIHAITETRNEVELGTATTDSASTGYSQMLQSAVLMLCHASHAQVIARELMYVLWSSNSVNSIRVISISQDGTEQILAKCGDESASDRVRCICVGGSAERTIEIRFEAKTDANSVMTVEAAAHFVRFAKQLSAAIEDNNERTSIWPNEKWVRGDSSAVISGHMHEQMTYAERVARTTVNVLITGESGTGKEILARAIHQFSNRAQKPFVPLNCAAVPRDLLESQLFGHRRGAFTGAERDQIGVIRSAAGGTLFLDEVGEMSLELQPKLLRFLESGEISPLGEPAPLTVNVRVIAATNGNLEDAVRDGRFREDLFYRLNVVRLSLKPLRERRDEIPGLVTHFVDAAAREYQKGRLEIAEETMEHLLLYRWPGNVRQLHNEIRRMVALADANSTLQPEAISADILGKMPQLRHPPPNGREISVALQQKLLPTLAQVECEMIKAALRDNHGRLEPAAKALGISRKGLYLKRQRLGL
jgi:transcriptional regulator with PAS, ATPase and Fis domain/tetratricopeptide (TPR) repeat protein